MCEKIKLLASSSVTCTSNVKTGTPREYAFFTPSPDDFESTGFKK